MLIAFLHSIRNLSPSILLILDLRSSEILSLFLYALRGSLINNILLTHQNQHSIITHLR